MSRGGENTLWVERAARWTGFDRLAASLFDDERYAPYLFVLVTLFLDAPVLSTVNYLRGRRAPFSSPWWQWPGAIWWLIPALVLLGLFLLRTLSERHDHAARAVGKGDDAEPVVDPTLSRRLQYGMLLLGTLVYAVWLSTTIGNVVEREGPLIGAIKFLLFIPAVYNPIATDLAAVYLQIQLALPARVRRADVPLDFSDPSRLGGFYPVGRVMWLAAVSAFVALTLYTVLWTFGFVNDPDSFPAATRTTLIVFFVLTWSLAAVTHVAGLYLVHGHMATARDEQLRRIHERIRAMGSDEETLPYTDPDDDAEFRAYLQEYVKLDRVERTRTTPFDVVVAWELVGAAVIPVAIQVGSLLL